ncbi:MAG: hypothetical protein ACI841_004352 [Planctomycetota bacterium]|jgi:hypothetical protein
MKSSILLAVASTITIASNHEAPRNTVSHTVLPDRSAIRLGEHATLIERGFESMFDVLPQPTKDGAADRRGFG